ncbi:DUF2924 domain-containing protein [Methylobacterium iners]|uniref:Bacteriophage-related protein n=1 Tax=Methylobacterium iners TaxID=418707 RepID=A0ABQ4S497_9HYPH|nr:DUF2924 domain-containing protein [Methylobacterium iners]GJD97886.1 hypothetical protein OCOJLMKI_5125 [Methylobacterium iners]
MRTGSQRTPQDDRLSADLARLAMLDPAGLQRRWRMVFGRSAPEHLSRALMHRVLAYRLQVDRHGDLSPATTRLLDRLRPDSPAEVLPPPDQPGTKPGTLLVREWKGELHRVMVLDPGFAWQGTTYDSLSRVAQAITGTKWNGPRFFGLRERPSSAQRSDAR